MKLTPAQYVIHVFGGVRACARALEKSPAAISTWHSNGGRVPKLNHPLILDVAKKNKLDIKPSDLTNGRNVAISKIRENEYRCGIIKY